MYEIENRMKKKIVESFSINTFELGECLQMSSIVQTTLAGQILQCCTILANIPPVLFPRFLSARNLDCLHETVSINVNCNN